MISVLQQISIVVLSGGSEKSGFFQRGEEASEKLALGSYFTFLPGRGLQFPHFCHFWRSTPRASEALRNDKKKYNIRTKTTATYRPQVYTINQAQFPRVSVQGISRSLPRRLS
jgi:hypothetical protein